MHQAPSNKDTDSLNVDDQQQTLPGGNANSNSNAPGDDESSIVSETSTLEYTQEPFETFKNKVLALMLQLYPSYAEENFEMERKTGGSYN